MIQRKKQPDKTRRAILDATHEEFSKKGYSNSGLGGITVLAGLTKGALFHHFPDKRTLAKSWVVERLAPAVSELWISPLAAAASLDQFRGICEARFSGSRPDDAVSALTALASEIGTSDQVLSEEIERVFGEWREALAGFFQRGKEAGWVYAGIRPEQEAAMVILLFTGFCLLGRLPGSAEHRRLGLAALDGYLETLRPQ